MMKMIQSCGLGLAMWLGAAHAEPLSCLIEPDRVADVGAASVGVIEEVRVERGDRVKAGQVLATLSSGVERASVAVAQAKALSTSASLLAGSKLFELAGTASTLAGQGLDRFWRNARTHTLHDPARWKYHLIGNFVLNGVKPARHAWN